MENAVDKSDLDAMRTAQKTVMDMTARNIVFAWTWPFVMYSALVLAINPRR